MSNDYRFTLSIFTSGTTSAFTLSEDEETPNGHGMGEQTWAKYVIRDSVRTHPHSTLAMQKNGNLVFRLGNGHKVWASGTAGTGHRNEVTLRNDGNLVMRTASGRRVWSSHTSAVYMVAGQQLNSGRSLVNRSEIESDPGATRLTMTRRGDLVLTRGAKRVWQSDTHAPGSILQMRHDGRLVVVTPANRVLWRAPRFSRNDLMALAHDGRFNISGPHGQCWQRPTGRTDRCGTG